jgi:hypothetical protein
MRTVIWLSFVGVMCSVSMSAFAEPWLYLGEGKESLKPQLQKAVKLIAKQPECLKVTEGTWGEAGKDIDIPGRSGLMFRVTCQVSDLPAWPYDNFWIAPDELQRSSIYRQTKRKFLSEGK